MAKRRSMQTSARRERGHAKSPYAKRNKKEHKYPFPTGPGSHEARAKLKAKGES